MLDEASLSGEESPPTVVLEEGLKRLEYVCRRLGLHQAGVKLSIRAYVRCIHGVHIAPDQLKWEGEEEGSDEVVE